MDSLNNESGILGICGVSNDISVGAAVDEGNKQADLALEHYKYKNAIYCKIHPVSMQKECTMSLF